MDDSMSPEEAVSQLYDEYADDVYRYALYTLSGTSDPRDVVQEVFFRAFQSWHRYRGDAHVKTWLFRIAKNYIYDLLRKKRSEQNYLQHFRPNLSELSTSLDTLIELEDVVHDLPNNYRQVFVLRCVEELSVRETAKVLGWSEAKVKTTLHRALKQVRSLLETSDTKAVLGSEGETGGF